MRKTPTKVITSVIISAMLLSVPVVAYASDTIAVESPDTSTEEITEDMIIPMENENAEDAQEEIATETMQDEEYVASAAVDSGTCGDNLTWKLTGTEEDGYQLYINGTSNMYDYKNESAPWSSYSYNIKKLYLQDDITSIGDCAFSEFYELEQVTLPSRLKQMNATAFLYDDKLNKIDISADNSYFTVADNILFNKNKTTLILCPPANSLSSYIVPSTVTKIAACAFRDCANMTTVKLHNKITSIGEQAFAGSNLKSISIPSSITEISDHTFYYCEKLTSVALPDTITSIGSNAFLGCYKLSSIQIPYSVKKIGDFAFTECEALTSIKFMGSAPSIGSSCFLYVTANAYYPNWSTSWTSSKRQNYSGTLTWKIHTTPTVTAQTVYTVGTYKLKATKVSTSGTGTVSVTGVKSKSVTAATIPSTVTINGMKFSVTAVASKAFQKCSKLTKVTVPTTVTSIGNKAFYSCSKLKTITIKSKKIKTVGSSAFKGINKKAKIKVPSSYVKKYKKLLKKKGQASTVTIGK